MAKNPDGSTRLNPDGSVYITPVPSVRLNLDAHGNSLDPNTFVHYQSDPDFGTPIQAKAGGTYVVMGQRPQWQPDMTAAVCDFGGLPSTTEGTFIPPKQANPTDAESIEDTYDNPGDNPYISNYEPKQFGYMNDLSTLSPDELDYRAGNIKGLDDRQNSVENAGSFLNNYLLDNNLFKEKVNKTPETKVGTISRESDNESDELYGRNLKESPYDKYDSSKYY